MPIMISSGLRCHPQFVHCGLAVDDDLAAVVELQGKHRAGARWFDVSTTLVYTILDTIEGCIDKLEKFAFIHADLQTADQTCVFPDSNGDLMNSMLQPATRPASFLGRSLILLACGLCLLVLLSGCGQTGGLYLPNPDLPNQGKPK